MKYLKTLAMAFLGTAYASAVLAADVGYPTKAAPYMSAPAAANWSGLYLSGYGLYGANLTNTSVGAPIGSSSTVNPLADLASAPHGPGVGGSFGYNYQFAPNGLVLGVRADIAYANMQGGGNATPNINGVATVNALSVSNATNYLGDLDVIAGLPLTGDGRLLGYLGGGFAFGGAKPNLQVASLSAAANDTSTGWNVLAGLAYQLDPHWQIFMEGDYFQLGDKSLSIADPTSTTGGILATSNTKYHVFEQKIGVSFKF